MGKEPLVREDLALQELLGSLGVGGGEQDLHLNWLYQGPRRPSAVGVQRREKSLLLWGLIPGWLCGEGGTGLEP